jgi:L-cysteine:1D-myo-inositol 2-amino-2-deoxy-alpha-D-glucopyranoside ligase
LIDIQGGGRDLIFPHHFMSAIQVKAITGQQFSRGYIHTGMIGLNGEKMSKSKGNLVFVSKLLQAGIDPVVIRFALLREHYGADRMWSDEVLSRATIDVARIRDALARNEVAPTHDLITHIVDALSEDLDTPRVFELLFEWVLATESGIPGGSTGELSRALDSALGLAF